MCLFKVKRVQYIPWGLWTPPKPLGYPYRDAVRELDISFQKFILKGRFYDTVERMGTRAILERYASEKYAGVNWKELTYRVLSAEKFPEIPSNEFAYTVDFVITKDKSDIRRNLEQQVESERIYAKIKEQEEAFQRRLVENANLINSYAELAITKKELPARTVWVGLYEKGLLKPSTTFRSTTLFPGEEFLLRYDFTKCDEGGLTQTYAGFIGFDKNLALISIDERLPVDNTVYIESRPSNKRIRFLVELGKVAAKV